MWFVLKEWLPLASALGLAGTSVYVWRLPEFSPSQMHMLVLLWVLFVTVKGLADTGLVASLSRRLEKGRWIPVKLVAVTFVLSMFVTNDIAVITVVPLTLSMNIRRKDILVILEALAANAGSALTPFGNPQNLFIFWSYGMSSAEFVASIAPFSLFFLGVLLLAAVAVGKGGVRLSETAGPAVRPAAWAYGGLLVVVVLTVLRVLPLAAVAVVPAYALLLDRRALRVDYGLLFAFLCLFGLAGNVKVLLSSSLEHSGHVFVLSAASSQVISNVPAALLFAKFTKHWRALLWGTNVGGFGSLVSSVASLIAYRLYVNHAGSGNRAWFAVKFVALGYVMFLLGMGLYWATHVWF